MTRAQRERRRQQLEADAALLVSLISETYPLFERAERERSPRAEVWPLEAYLCFAWSVWERTARPELHELAKAHFWDEGQRQLEAMRRAREERYDKSNHSGN